MHPRAMSHRSVLAHNTNYFAVKLGNIRILDKSPTRNMNRTIAQCVRTVRIPGVLNTCYQSCVQK